MTTEPAVLSCENISLWRGEAPIIENLSLSIGAGEVWRLEGENGSGKTTLLRILAGLVEIEEGIVRFRGKALPAARQALAEALLYIGHRPGVGGALDASENLDVAAAIAGDNVDKTRQAEILDTLGLSDKQQVPVAALSAGQRRRVALARLALEQRDVWLLDEPLTALDAKGLEWVREQIARQVSNGGTVVFTTHQPLDLPGLTLRSLVLTAPDPS